MSKKIFVLLRKILASGMEKNSINKHILFVVSGPSGSGKGTLMDYATENFKSIQHIPTYTTRNPRPSEIKGKDYNYLTQKDFMTLVGNGGIFEYTKTYGDYMYGSPLSLIENQYNKNLIVELDYKGMFRVKSVSQHRVVSIFVLPPDIKTLKTRITKRFEEENLTNRLKVISEQLQFAWAYDYVIVNNDYADYLSDIQTILKAEILRTRGVDSLLDMKHSSDPTLNQTTES